MNNPLDKIDDSRPDLTILAVIWDDISGPSVISMYPSSVLTDPESVALQIYLASVTVFGQHGNSQRTEFSVPLLSLGEEVAARVAFDSWLDSTLRGKERPFFLAFLADQETLNRLKTHFDVFIFEYLDMLKEEKLEFIAQKVWEKIFESYNILIQEEHFEEISLGVDSDYSIPHALKDLQTAKMAWEKLKDRNQLWTVLKIANRLENIDDRATGEAFSLIGEIFLDRSNYDEALEAFEKAADAYARVRLFEKSGESSCLAGRCAYYLQNYDKAIDLLQAGSLWIKNPLAKASLNFDMGNVLHEQKRFEESNSCFEKAIKIVESINKSIAADYSSTFASRLMVQAEKEKELNPTYALGLIRRSAEQRKNAAKFLQLSSDSSIEAATSLILAANAYFLLGNIIEGVSMLEETTNLFIEANDYISAAKALYDGALQVKDIDKAYKLLTRAATLLMKQDKDIKRNHLLGLILFEKAKIEEKNNQIKTSLNSYDQALTNLENSNSPILNLIAVLVQYANLLFNCENFEKAAEAFFTANKLFSNISYTDAILQQKRKTLLNALISLRRASTIYHNAGIVSLKNKNEKHSIEMFAHSVSILLDWVDNNSIDEKEKIQKVLDDRTSSLSMKIDFFLLAESKYKMKAIIESLKFTNQKNDSDNH